MILYIGYYDSIKNVNTSRRQTSLKWNLQKCSVTPSSSYLSLKWTYMMATTKIPLTVTF